jgi:signal transduction histidine kinase/ActR/RegA family two-component response regulator
MSLRKWLTTLILMPLILVVCQAVGLLALAQATRGAERDGERVSELYSSVAQVTTSLLQADVQARAFAVTHDPHNLDTYIGATQALQFQFSQLYAQSQAEPVLARQIPELQRLADVQVNHLDAIVRLTQRKGATLTASEADTRGIELFSIAQKHFADVAYDIRAQRLAGLERLWNVSIGVLVFAAVCGLIVTVALALLAQRHIARRIESVERHARSYASGLGSPDAPAVGGDDEIARLDGALRTMADTIAAREGELRLALKEAQAASQAKSAFVATMSHEIRTPLNGVIGMTELLLESPLSTRQQEYAETIRTSSDLLLDVINDILDFSKISAGAVSLKSNVLGVESLLHSATSLFSAQAREKGLEIRTLIAESVPQSLEGDELRLKQILVNLVGNAVKFTPSGSVTVTVSADAPAGERTMVSFAIADTGIGVPESMRSTIFEPFQQADMSKTRPFGGTGLGLSISRQLVTMMDGTLSLRSPSTGGSIFSFTIPFRTMPVAAERAAVATVAAPSARPVTATRPESVLLVEDNEINQRVATRLLQRLGLEPHIAANGREALDALERTSFDLVLMDLQMPVMDGFEASTELRRRELHSGGHIPIVAMTANALPEDREACFAVGMDDHVAKPVTLTELRRVLHRWLPERAQA